MPKDRDFHAVLNYEPKTGKFFWKKKTGPRVVIGAEAGHKNTRGYVIIQVFGKPYKAHRLAWFMAYGKWPENEIDHINEVKSDNRISNLRDVTHGINQLNSSKTNGKTYTGTRGIYIDRGRYRVMAGSQHIGNFLTLKSAKAAREYAVKELINAQA